MERDKTILRVVTAPLEAQQALVVEQVGLREIGKDMFEAHCTFPGTKLEGICHILYENANRIDCCNMHHPKVVKAWWIHNMLEADILAYNEHWLNLRHKGNRIGSN